MILTIFLIFSMLTVIWLDVTKYIIPNWLSGLMLLLYPVAVWMSPVSVDWKMDLLGMAIVFAVGYVVFALRWMGGGDIKLITVCALWVGLGTLPDYLFLVAVIGGVFSILLWGLRKAIPYLPQKGILPRILKNGEPVPYGVAIALGLLIMIWSNRIPLLVPIGG